MAGGKKGFVTAWFEWWWQRRGVVEVCGEVLVCLLLGADRVDIDVFLFSLVFQLFIYFVFWEDRLHYFVSNLFFICLSKRFLYSN